MGSDSNGRQCCLSPEDAGPWFALVIYVPGKLCEFLDDLRRELMPGCNPHAHVSVLPPRPLQAGWEAARDQARGRMESRAAFHIEAGGIGLFPESEVVYLEIDAGARELRNLHTELNSGPMAFAEPFAYHPHITLAQDIQAGRLDEVRGLAEQRWREYEGERSFLAERAILVRRAGSDRWEDLAGIRLGAFPAARR